MRFPLLTALLVPLVSNAASGADFPQFRGPGGQGVADESNLPVSWSEEQNIAWKTELPGAGSSSPIVIGERIIVTCYSGYGIPGGGGALEDLKLHVVCLSPEGKIQWTRDIEPAQPESARVRDHGYAGPTPASDGEHVYVFFGKTGVLKLDLDGKLLWQTQVGDSTHGWGCGTSPILFGDLVIVNASVESRALVALDKQSGKEVWRAAGMKSSWNTPHLVALPNGATELVVSVQGKILAFDPATGESLWQCDGIQDYVCPSVVSAEGVVYVIGGRTSRAIAVRAGGRGDVTSTHRLWEARAGANVCSPVIHDGHLYWVSDRNQVAYCVRLSDGEIMYSERFRGQPYASTLAAGGKLYVVTRSSGAFVLAAQPEFKILAHNKLDDDSQFQASPAAANGRLYLRSDKALYAIGD